MPVNIPDMITCEVFGEKMFSNFSWENPFFFLLDFPDTEDASETDLAKHDEDDYVEIKEQ